MIRYQYIVKSRVRLYFIDILFRKEAHNTYFCSNKVYSMKRLPIFLLVIVFILLASSFPQAAFCQIDDPGCDPFDPLCPIDGGVSFLIAAGVGLAARKAFIAAKTVEQGK